MATPSHPLSSSAPEFAGILRNRLDNIPHKTVALDAKLDASLLGKFLAGNAALKLEDVSSLVRIAGLKAVSKDRVCISREELALLRRTYAKAGANAPWLLDEEEVE